MFQSSLPSIYDHIYAYKKYRDEVQNIEEILETKDIPSQHILELATGTGCYLEHFCRDSRQIVGIDICEESLMYASFRIPTGKFYVCDMTALSSSIFPVEHQKFDVVLALFGAIGYVPPEKLQSCIENWINFLTPSGVLILEPWHEHPEEGIYHQQYTSNHLNIHREAQVQCIEKQTIMNFVYTIEAPNQSIQRIESTEILWAHPFSLLQDMIHNSDAHIVYRQKSDFSETGQWYIQKEKKSHLL